MRWARRTALILTLATGLTAACSSDKVVENTTTSVSSTTAPTVTTSTTAGLVGASASPVSTPDQGHVKLAALAATDQGAFDRLTFTFQGGLPGYVVEYTNRPIQQDASGETVEVKGDNVLRFRFAGASGVDLSGGKVTSTYTGPKRFSPSTASIAEVVQTGDFEDVLNWVAGVRGKPRFKVTANAAPGTITVDVEHLP